MDFVVKKYKNANISRTVRFTPELFDTLSQVAADQDVAFNSLILQCCEFALSNLTESQQPKRKTQSME